MMGMDDSNQPWSLLSLNKTYEIGKHFQKVQLGRNDAGAGRLASASSSPPTLPSMRTAAATAGSIWTRSRGSPTSRPSTTSASTARRVHRARNVSGTSVAGGVLAAR